MQQRIFIRHAALPSDFMNLPEEMSWNHLRSDIYQFISVFSLSCNVLEQQRRVSAVKVKHFVFVLNHIFPRTTLMVSLLRHAVSFLVLHQWGEAGATVGGARLAEVASLFGTVYMGRARSAS